MTTSELQSEHHRQINRLPILMFLLASVLVHGLALLVYAVVKRSQPEVRQQEKNNPIEFVIVLPEESTQKPPPDTKRIAARNSVAQGKVKSEQPESTPPEPSTVVQPQVPTSPSSPSAEPNPATVSQPKPSQPPQSSTPQELDQPIKPNPAIASQPEPSQPPQSSTLQEFDQPNKPTITSQSNSATTKPTQPNPETDTPVATRLPPQIKPIQPTPSSPTPDIPANSGAASLLGGTQSKSIAQDGVDSFFESEIAASQESPYATLDAQQNDLGPYFAEIKRRVKRNWQPTFLGDNRHTILTFSIQRNGQITGLQVVQSSGSEKVDQDSLAAVQQSAPFDPLPQSFPRPSLDIEFNFNIYVHQNYQSFP